MDRYIAFGLPIADERLRLLVGFFATVFCVGPVLLLAGALWIRRATRDEPPGPPPPWPRRDWR